ncbi:winged helix-turn-helix domain-containing protein [Paraneptunicella aestuarii]|uniref:winged helix-turn-helix domain-containing protein n=1 Tax=Paraneptunicella aestuarii TaxID=2831148 RepID=UPI001E38F10C|nr:winged helix-turn-helix domain-containing protein [Paraneptunicella aestuarii]UAA38713.1 winged helix-turn-helix domain-containing protein [Paraneptunicella aestuarii]
MKHLIKTHQYIINPVTREIRVDGSEAQSISLRPKTFELLLLLLEEPLRIFSKQDILDTVWAGSVVEEQVIFQSITEIRKAFTTPNLLTNYPKKGYAWTADVETLEEVSATSPTPEPKTNPNIKARPAFIYILPILMLAGLGIWQAQNMIASKQTISAPTQQSIQQGTVIMLPVQTSQTTQVESWMRLGLMDQVIGQLSDKLPSTVLQVEDVLDLLRRANINGETYSEQDIQALFQRSGAVMIIELLINGVPGEYELIYRLHSRETETDGVEVGARLDELLGKVSEKIILQKTGSQTHPFSSTSQFNNRLLAKGVELLKSGKSEQAIPIFQSAIIYEPDNHLLQYYLAKAFIAHEQYDDAITTLETTLANATKTRIFEYQGRLEYLLASLYLDHKPASLSESLLQQAQTHAQAENDWLYLAYVISLQGKLQQQQEKFNEAEQAFNTALNYQQIMGCPYGEVQNLLDLAELNSLKDEPQKARLQLNEARKVIKERHLEAAIPILQSIEEKLALSL